MDARLTCSALVLALANIAFSSAYRTQNFIVQTPSPEFARQVAEAAEQYRRELAIEWLGQELPPWQQPCPITVQVGDQLGAGGATSFMFERGVPFGWKMSIQGSAQRILDSVLPHEVTHTIFATHFGGPLPRWADEGGSTVVEHPEEREKQRQFLFEFLTTGRGIPFNVMFRLKEYPADILPLYAQGHSLAQYLIGQGGKRKFVDFVGEGMASNDWNRAVHQFYGYPNLSDLQLKWVDWVASGSPLPDEDQQYAVAQPAQNPPALDHEQLASLDRGPSAVAAGDHPASVGSVHTPAFTDLAAMDRVPNRQATRGSWYTAQRDAARAISLPNQSAGGVASLAPGSIPQRSVTPTHPMAVADAAAATARGSLARPQDLQQVQETVLDWGSPRPSHFPTASMSQVPYHPSSPPGQRATAAPATVWR